MVNLPPLEPAHLLAWFFSVWYLWAAVLGAFLVFRFLVFPNVSSTKEPDRSKMPGLPSVEEWTAEPQSAADASPPTIAWPTLKPDDGDDENQKMIDSAFAHYVSSALLNAAKDARITVSVKSKYGEIRTVGPEAEAAATPSATVPPNPDEAN